MRHLDLFSGIGGFALAARWSGFETVAFCEIDQYCQKVLARHWPRVPLYSDIKTLTRQGLEKDGISQPDIITGGFPCQPFSVAGKRKGQDDDRHLWPEMLRIISELHPAWIVGENVSGFVRLALDDCLSDLEGQGYSVESFIIPACAVSAPHRRDRVWLVGHAQHDGSSAPKVSREFDPPSHQKQRRTNQAIELERAGQSWHSENVESSTPCQKNVADSNGVRVETNRRFSQTKKAERLPFNADQCSLPGRPTDREWEPEPDVGRVVDGIPNRVDRLKGLGNAVVPQVVHHLFEIIKQVDNNNGR